MDTTYDVRVRVRKKRKTWNKTRGRAFAAACSFVLSSLTMDMLSVTAPPAPATRAPVKGVATNPLHPAIPATWSRTRPSGKQSHVLDGLRVYAG